jgi:HupE/UreJ protein
MNSPRRDRLPSPREAGRGKGEGSSAGEVKTFVMSALVIGVVLAFAGTAHAHKPSDSILTLSPGSGGGAGRWDIAVRDLDDVLALDADGDGQVTWGELRARQADVTAYALGHLRLRTSAGACALGSSGALAVTRHSDGAYVSLPLELGCPSASAGSALEIDYQLLFDIDPQHRGLVRVDDGQGDAEPVILTARDHRRALAWSGGPATRSSLASFVAEGVRHIWGGLDHVLFLIALLLPAVLRRHDGAWIPVPAIRPALADVVRTVSAFTLAHSLTLSLAALHLVAIPARLTESAIAASVVLAAINNIRPVFGRDRWVVAFALGLLHGFGFASVLADVGLPPARLVSSLLGFNLGVELGQLVVVAGCLPIAYLVRRTAAYRRITVPGVSAALAVVAIIWLVERALDVSLVTGRLS